MTRNHIQFQEYQLFTESNCTFGATPDKPTLVFLHDSWGCVEMWADFPKCLGELFGLNIFVYDRRGYGQSSPFGITDRTIHYLHDEAHELMQLLDSCKIQEVMLYGHSDGATIALIAAALYPNRVKGLMLESPHSFIEDSGKAAVLATRERAKETTLLETLTKFHGDKTHELFRLWHETWLSDFFASWTIVPHLTCIQCPVLAFQGEQDEFGTIEQLNVLKKEIQGSVTISEIPDAAHTPRKESADVTLALLKDWFFTVNLKYD